MTQAWLARIAAALTRSSTATELAGALKEFGVAMSELGKSQEGEAASALGALAACCASHATSSGAKAQALYTSLDVPMRDLVRCAGAAERRTQVMQHALALTLLSLGCVQVARRRARRAGGAAQRAHHAPGAAG